MLDKFRKWRGKEQGDSNLEGRIPFLGETLLVFVILVVAVPLVTNALFSIPAPFPLLEAKYEAGDFLEFVSGTLVGVGTMALSLFAFKRDKEAKDRERFNVQRPFLVLEDISVGDKVVKMDQRGRCVAERIEAKEILIRVKNIGNGPACGLRWREDSAFGTTPVMERTRIYLACGGEYSILLLVKELEKRGELEIPLTYANVLGCTYSQVMRVKVDLRVEDVRHEEIENGEVVDVPGDVSLMATVTSLGEQKERLDKRRQDENSL